MTATQRVILMLESEEEIYRNMVWFVNNEKPDWFEMKDAVLDMTLTGSEGKLAEEFITAYLAEVDWWEVIYNFVEEDEDE